MSVALIADAFDAFSVDMGMGGAGGIAGGGDGPRDGCNHW